MEYNPQALLGHYTDHLNNTILPFWLSRAMDTEAGGYYTCFSNTGSQLLSQAKYTWSQGRMVWILSKLATLPGTEPRTRERYVGLAEMGARFLMEHAVLDNGHCTFVMDRKGAPQEQHPGMGYDTSIFADCFVILGLSRHAMTSGSHSAREFAHSLYHSVLERLTSGDYRTEPYPTPPGYRAHAIPMIMLNVSQELELCLQASGDPQSKEVRRRADAYMAEIMECFLVDGIVHEMIDCQNRPVGTILGRHVNPGHTIEAMWFVMHQGLATQRRDVVERAAEVVAKTVNLGWDRDYGGLLLFVDQEGGCPRGSTRGIEQEIMVQKIQNDWQSKLWWPHSEALYATLLAFHMTEDQRFWDLYKRVHEYTFATFPNPDPNIGEWIQIRNRAGEPESKVVALPVKDPYHIARNLILIIELLWDLTH